MVASTPGPTANILQTHSDFTKQQTGHCTRTAATF